MDSAGAVPLIRDEAFKLACTLLKSAGKIKDAADFNIDNETHVFAFSVSMMKIAGDYELARLRKVEEQKRDLAIEGAKKALRDVDENSEAILAWMDTYLNMLPHAAYKQAMAALVGADTEKVVKLFDKVRKAYYYMQKFSVINLADRGLIPEKDKHGYFEEMPQKMQIEKMKEIGFLVTEGG